MSWERQLGFYFGIIGFCIGNCLVYLTNNLHSITIAFLLLGLVSTLLYAVQSRLVFLYLSFLCCLCVIGMFRTQVHQQSLQYNPMDTLVGQETSFQTWVCEEPDVREFNTRLTVCHDQFHTKSLVKTTLYPTYFYGDSLSVTGVLEKPVGFVGDTDRFFDYKNFLLQDGVRYVANYPTIIKTGDSQGNPIKHALLSLKHSFIHKLNLQLPEPHSSFMAGLLLGAKSSMGPELLDDFRTTGVIHIVVLSGFNITIIVWAIMSILAFFGLITSSVIGSIAILFFAIMTGAGATVVRASLMAFLVILARLTGNDALVIRMLFLSGFIMLFVNPMLLLYSPSFQLSFVATFGLIALAPFISRRLMYIPNPSWAQIRELLAATIATQIMVTPLLLYMMGTFPTYSLFANFLILATVPYVMAIGFLAIVVSYVSFMLALPFAGLAYYILEYDLLVVSLFTNLPFSSFVLSPFGFKYVVASYAWLALMAAVTHRQILKQGITNICIRTKSD